MRIAQLKAQLRKQNELLDSFGNLEHELQSAIIDRDWPTMDKVMPRLEHLSRDLEALERRRHDTVSKIKQAEGLNDAAPFSEVVLKAADDDRTELAELYRELQIAVLRVKNHTAGIDSYVRNSVRTANSVLGEVFPERKGTIYSRSGVQSPARSSAMVLNHEM